MAAPYLFSLDDQMNPVYCIGCRQHIPIAVSNSGAGYCPPCQANNQAQAAAQQAAQAQALAQQQAAQQAQATALHQTSTGLGMCPQCKSLNVVQFDNEVANTTRSGLTTGGAVCMLLGIVFFCVGGAFLFGLGLILFVVGLCVPSKKIVGTSRACNYCGNRWQV